MNGTTSSYTAMIQRGGKLQPHAAATDKEDDDDDNNGPVPGPKSLSSIELAHSHSKFSTFYSSVFHTHCPPLSAQGYPCRAEAFANHIGEPQFMDLL